MSSAGAPEVALYTVCTQIQHIIDNNNLDTPSERDAAEGCGEEQLWPLDDGQAQRSTQLKPNNLGARSMSTRHSQQHKDSDQCHQAEEPSVTVMIHHLETKPITAQYLAAVAKVIYTGLLLVEEKCILYHHAYLLNNAQLDSKQWHALISLHQTLLHEHFDFLLASQHPSASPALRRLVAKNAMPERMWRHGIYSFLELLLRKLPLSLEPMLAFIYIAYNITTLQYEVVPAFKETWIRCLSDLARCRMAIEHNDIGEREKWSKISYNWYSKLSDTSPTTRTLYHHLGSLARGNALQRVHYHAKL